MNSEHNSKGNISSSERDVNLNELTETNVKEQLKNNRMESENILAEMLDVEILKKVKTYLDGGNTEGFRICRNYTFEKISGTESENVLTKIEKLADEMKLLRSSFEELNTLQIEQENRNKLLQSETCQTQLVIAKLLQQLVAKDKVDSEIERLRRRLTKDFERIVKDNIKKLRGSLEKLLAANEFHKADDLFQKNESTTKFVDFERIPTPIL